MDGTTTIKIDYYEELKRKADFVDKMVGDDIYKEFEELKAKADKYDEKETGSKPEMYNEKTRTYLCGNCQQFIDKIDSYCVDCGYKHDWSNL